MRRAASFVAVVLFVLVLCPAPGAAAPRLADRPAWGAAPLGGSVFWSVLRVGLPGLARLLEKIGISMDPDGRPCEACPRSSSQKIGPSMDPDGRPEMSPALPALSGEIGSGIEPNGHLGDH